MSKPTRPSSHPYSDGPDAGTSSDALSLHTTPDDYDYDDVPQLPSYSDSQASAAAETSNGFSDEDRAPWACIPLDPYHSMTSRNHNLQTVGRKISNLNETTYRMFNQLNDPDHLQKYVEGYLSNVPPSPVVKIVGSHTETHWNASSKKNEKNDVTDFHIALSMQKFLGKPENRNFWRPMVATNGDKVYRGGWRKTRAKGYNQDIEVGEEETPGLRDWCREFCNSKSPLKMFRVTRSVHGLDVDYLKHQIEGIVRSTYYHGKVSIAIHTESKHVDIYAPHWINSIRLSGWRWFFYLTFLWIFTWPFLYFATKVWAVYSVSWLWFYCHQDHENERAFKVFVTVSEAKWLQRHSNLIKSLVLEKFEGDASDFPSDVPDERVNQASRTAMPSTGNQNIDSAVGFVQGGLSVWNAVQGRGTRDNRAWGYDS